MYMTSKGRIKRGEGKGKSGARENGEILTSILTSRAKAEEEALAKPKTTHTSGNTGECANRTGETPLV